MAVWLGQLVISKANEATTFKVQYWRNPNMSPAYLRFDCPDDLRRFLQHCRLAEGTPEQVIDRLGAEPELVLSTLESQPDVMPQAG